MSELTDWEVGQELILMSDYLLERLEDISEKEHPDLFLQVHKCRAFLGDYLDELESHPFGMYNSSDFKKVYGSQAKGRRKNEHDEKP